jgi:hypothetical protein
LFGGDNDDDDDHKESSGGVLGVDGNYRNKRPLDHVLNDSLPAVIIIRVKNNPNNGTMLVIPLFAHQTQMIFVPFSERYVSS